MLSQYHILNGDALKHQFPKVLPGKSIIARECLVEGTTKGDDFDSFFKNRARFISESHAETEENYLKNVKSEFQKILDINEACEINLWFEQDLFCQANLWFVASLIVQTPHVNNVFLVMPKEHTPFGFGGLSEPELIAAYNHRKSINNVQDFAKLWQHYQNNNLEDLKETAKNLKKEFPFILPAVKAHIARIPKKEDPGRPVTATLKIMDELQTDDFNLIFREFCKRESIYGFGDLQVKKLVEKAKNL
ncbi:DUF1835 domain-containing protein [Zunongwangia pacifica]|uniref:DUF1835 domain-containing protein n=1 Tax=Zunongwangia pacifica TaxID=2911062 RepID=A0A9X1ZXA3_9FLAO|nr:DUF1835 domain-containing protein [Zunongwangia pacifica]MCL6218096.1 DUF1835 domain-containing protein [Zunongwangia pacifica]